MSLRFALRPRIVLHESAPARRRARPKLPPVVLPIAGYWLFMAALTHLVILVGKGEAAEPSRAIAEPEPAEPSRVIPAPEPPEPAEPTAAIATWEPPVNRTEPAIDRTLASDTVEEAPLPERPPKPDAEQRDYAALPLSTPEPAPRVASRAPEPDREEEPSSLPERFVQTPPERDFAPASSGLPSCEAVVAASSQDVDFGGRARTPDLSDEAFSRVLNHGGYLSGCSIPDRTALDICVAVQEGRVRGVSVQAHPANSRVSACVAAAAARLRFPHSPRLDVARTHFDALR
jgi:hypothetical protein